MKIAVKHVARASSVALASALLFGTASAHADPCITAYEQTQTLRKDGKPVAAKAQAAICARESCPALLTKDCSKWLAELEAASPTVILDPRGPNGALRTDARIKLDGAPLPEKVDGKAMPLEPGSHTFVFEIDGAPPAEQTIVLREGEKNRKVTAALALPSPARETERPVPTGVWLFGGAAVVALATSTVFGIVALGKKSDLDACKPNCAASDVDSMSSSFTFADVALGAGVMAGAAALYLYLTRPSLEVGSPSAPSTGRAKTVPFASPLPGGGTAGFVTRF